MANPVDTVASFVEYYLPVFIPVIFAALSIFAGMLTGRIEKTVNGLLKTHSELVLGMFSFVAWGIIANYQNQRIALNHDYTISLIRVFFLLVSALFALIGGQILVSHQFESKRKEEAYNGAFVFSQCCCYWLPSR